MSSQDAVPEEAAIPEEFFCPITLEVMVDPVSDNEGHTYERAAIEDWIKLGKPSPLSNKPLKLDDLRPNYLARNAISRFFADQGKPVPECEYLARLKKGGAGAAAIVGKDFETTTDHGLKIKVSGHSKHLLVSLKAPALAKRTPVLVCCVVDISGSMGTEVVLKDAAGKTEKYGLSRLDLVQHALRTIVESLSEEDYFSLVTFESNVEVPIWPQVVSAKNKKTILESITQLEPQDMTDLWGTYPVQPVHFSIYAYYLMSSLAFAWLNPS